MASKRELNEVSENNNKKIKLTTKNNNNNKITNEPWVFDRLKLKKNKKPAYKHYKLKEKDLKLATPIRMIVSGASGSGKTHFIGKLCDRQAYMFTTPPEKIIFYYNTLTDKIKSIATRNSNVILRQGLSMDLVEANDPQTHIWVIVDDFMLTKIYKFIAEIFTIKSRAKNVSISILTQNIYTKGGDAGRYSRDILVNCTHSALFMTKRDIHSIRAIASAVYLDFKFFMSSFLLACRTKTSAEYGQSDNESDSEDESEKDSLKRKDKQYRFLFLTLSPETKQETELRSQIFYKHEPTALYWPR